MRFADGLNMHLISFMKKTFNKQDTCDTHDCFARLFLKEWMNILIKSYDYLHCFIGHWIWSFFPREKINTFCPRTISNNFFVPGMNFLCADEIYWSNKSCEWLPPMLKPFVSALEQNFVIFLFLISSPPSPVLRGRPHVR